MKKHLLFSILTSMLLFFSSASSSQTLELGILSSFEVYTGTGAATGPGATGNVTGDVGSNDGIVAGFTPPNFNGTIYNNDATTVQARIDLLRVYIHLSDVFVTHPAGGSNAHAPAFGGGETISPGVYSIEGAGSIGGTLTLDGGGDPDAYFIMKFEGGFSVGVGSTIVLTNGTRACNVFWIAEGAISVGASSVIKGTLFSHPGAVTLGAGCNIEGRLFSSEGAMTVAAGSVAEMPAGPITIPINCLGDCSAAPSVDVLGSIKNFALFTSDGAVSNAATSGIVGNVGTNTGGDITGFGTSTLVGSFHTADAVTAQAKIDLDSAYAALMALENTELGHAPAFGQPPAVGSGEVVTAGVYYIGGAGSIAGTVVLDGEGDPDAIFVFKFNGAFSVAAQAKVILTNGTRRCNVFWISEGAASMGTFTVMKGTVLAHAGACTIGANGNVEGRMLSTAGAVVFSTGVIYNDTLCFGDDTPISGGDQTFCSDGTTTQTLTATATSNTTNGNITWYDAPTSGNTVSSPTQVGVGTITYYAESFNGTFASEVRTAVTLSIRDCISASDDNFTPIFESGGNSVSVLDNDTLDGILLNLLDITLTPGTTPTPTSGSITMNTDGTITVSNGTTPGTYSYPYTICENANLTNCSTAIATIIVSGGTPMITQVYQFDDERWIEVTNVHATNSIAANLVNIQLYKDKTGNQTGITPDVAYLITTILAPGKSVLFKNTANAITNVNSNANILENNTLTDFENGDDIITLSSINDATSYASRYDIVTSFANKTSVVRIDETLTPNKTYTPSEWVVFIDDNLDPYQLQGDGGAQRHPHDPLISEITNSNIDANTLLGLHRINSTTRTSAAWNNGYPDRSRFVVIDQDYNHTIARLSARKLTINASKKLSITNNVLVVTNDIILNGDIRLVDLNMTSASQLIQTHTSATLVTGTGRLLVDQNSLVPSLYRYNYIGSPVMSTAGAENYTVAGVLKDGTIATNAIGVINTNIAKNINWTSGYDGATTDPISLAEYWIYTYAASAGVRAGWSQKFSNGTIPNTDGFLFKGPGRAQNYTYLGIPKDGQLTTSIGQGESYLVANPYASAISVKEFIEDNSNAISGTLYFWEHAGEVASSAGSSDGHNFGGYIGGYATRTIAMGVSAENAASGALDNNFPAENATITNGTIETVSVDSESIDVVTLNDVNQLVTFQKIAYGVDTLRIRYKANTSKILRIKENNVTRLDLTLPATSGSCVIAEINLCVVVGSNITFESLDTNEIQLDYLNLKDDGKTGCAPTVGSDDFTYTEPEPYIAIGQGFFVQGDNSAGGIIEFNNSQREYKLEETGSSVFLRSKAKKTAHNILNLPVIKLGLKFKNTTDNREYHRQIGVSFSQHNSFNFDKGYDAEIYDIGNTSFYWKFPSDDSKYVISGVQDISDDLEVPLEIMMGYSGNISISLDEMKNISRDVYITDKLTDISYDIINNKAALTLDQGVYTDRFVLAFTKKQVLSDNDLNLLDTAIKIYVNKNSIVLSKSEELNIKNVELYNILGKKVSSWDIRKQKNKYQLETKAKIHSGIYIIKLETNKGQINKKLLFR